MLMIISTFGRWCQCPQTAADSQLGFSATSVWISSIQLIVGTHVSYSSESLIDIWPASCLLHTYCTVLNLWIKIWPLIIYRLLIQQHHSVASRQWLGNLLAPNKSFTIKFKTSAILYSFTVHKISIFLYSKLFIEQWQRMLTITCCYMIDRIDHTHLPHIIRRHLLKCYIT